jgi:4-diphosphocytidyl-2C-methyl-D-erythritol kinase
VDTAFAVDATEAGAVRAGIGEIDGAVNGVYQIMRAMERRAFAPVGEHGDGSVLLRAGDAIALAEHVRNDLQAAALSLRPELRDALELGEQAGALAGMVSGSGPTLAFLAGDAESALELQVVLSAAGFEALHVHGPVHGARLL